MKGVMKLFAAIGAVALVLAASAGGASQAVFAHAIVVSGDASVAVSPDRAQVSFGVSTDAKTASGALRANAAEMTKVIGALKGQGMAAADIRTDSISLYARYSSNGDVLV